MELFSNVLNILETKDKTHFFILLFVIFISMILEMLSIGLIVPIITLIINSSESFLNNYNFWLLEDILNKSKESQIMIVLSIFVTVYFLKSLYFTFLTIYLNTFSYNLKAKISKNLFQTYLNKKFNFFIENNSSILLRNIKDEPDLFVNQVFKPLLLLFVDCFLIVGIICVLIFYEPLISISVIILFLFIGTIFIKLTNKNITNQGLIRQKNDAQRIKNLTQAFNNIIEILILNVKKTILDKYNQPNSKSANATKINTIYQELPRVWLEMVGVAGILIVSSSMFYLDRNLDEIIPVLGLFSLAAFKILPTSNRILASLTSIKFGKPIIKIIKKNLQKKTLINKRNININFKKKIIFKNVSFSFSKKKK